MSSYSCSILDGIRDLNMDVDKLDEEINEYKLQDFHY